MAKNLLHPLIDQLAARQDILYKVQIELVTGDNLKGIVDSYANLRGDHGTDTRYVGGQYVYGQYDFHRKQSVVLFYDVVSAP